MKSALISFIILLLSSNAVFASISQTTTLEPIKIAVENADQNSLVIFDVDDVLIMPKDQIFKSANRTFYKQHRETLLKRLPAKKLNELWGVILKTRKSILVDPNVISVLASLKEHNIKTIALTKCGTGQVGQIQKLENWRIEDLAAKGIDFSQSFPHVNTVKFGQYTNKKDGNSPLHKCGIVFTAGLDKGMILRSFLKVAKFKPRAIIFVDDKRDNLESVEKLCQQWGIEFTGFHYLASQYKPDQAFDHKRARLQLAILKNQGKWLSDREADQILK